MDRQQQLVVAIKEWMRLDHEINGLRRQTKLASDQKKELSKQLVLLMKEKNLDEIDLTDGKIIRKTRTTKSGLNKKHIVECLEKYYKNNEGIVKELSTLILDSRKEKVNECIVCKKEK